MRIHPTRPDRTIDVVVCTEALFRRRRRWLAVGSASSVLGAVLCDVLTRAMMSVILIVVAGSCVVLLAWARDRRDVAYRLHSWAQVDWALMDHLRNLDEPVQVAPSLRLLRSEGSLTKPADSPADGPQIAQY